MASVRGGGIAAVLLAVLGCGEGTQDPCDESIFSCTLEWARWPVSAAPPVLQVNSETATDPVTGLVWQRSPREAMYRWERAKGYCEELVLAGQQDWRLPTRLELVMLVDYGRSAPAIDHLAFPETPSTEFWTSSRADTFSGEDRAWVVSMVDGAVKPQARDLLFPRARCVRAGDGSIGPPGTASKPGRFEVGKDTALEKATGLRWQRRPGFDPNWRQDYCSTLNLDGQTGWRLPHLRELLTLAAPVDPGGHYLNIQRYLDPEAFPELSGYDGAVNLSSTPQLKGTVPGSTWAVDFKYGIMGTELRKPFPRCVKSAR